jgi:hypothetical protein
VIKSKVSEADKVLASSADSVKEITLKIGVVSLVMGTVEQKLHQSKKRLLLVRIDIPH